MINPSPSSGTRGTSSALIDSSRVEGTRVFDQAGNDIGSIKRLVIEKVGGRVVYAVASFGAFLGLGGREYTIPWSVLSYDTDLGGYRTNISEAQLRGAPEFEYDDVDRHHEAALNDYYGSTYYWR